jgi:MYXO-CTERM domain-containing protein
MRKWLTVLAVLGFACTASADTLFDVGGFEGYALGNLPGQDGWVDDTTDPAYGQVQVLVDPTGAGMGNVIELDPPGTAGGWLGAARPFGPSALPIVTIEWDQYRTGVTDNLWVADSVAFDGWWAMQWDQNFQASSYFFDFGVPVSTGVWQHVIYTIDTVGGTATVEIVGVGSFSSAQPDTAIDGIVFELEPSESGGADGPTYIDNLMVTQTPEPASLALLALGGLALLRRR